MSIQFCGYILDNDWLLRRGMRKGLGTDKTEAARNTTLKRATYEILSSASIPDGRCRFRAVYHNQNVYACIALACNEPREGMPMVPVEADVEKLQKVLKTDAKPRWFNY
ncbi:hypothetical protein PLICRDRAFT_33385 [Plicaturopsis crispa FD-325 SS-3]|nr:hypothetical protein PLICRDRAFT_33385 [Plicaturopsis crispa FD-325 SS-3]